MIRVFISHAKEDGKIALKLKESLEREDFKAFSYEYDIPYAGKIPETIRTGIIDCDHFLVILSAEAQKSKYVARELGLALKLRKQRVVRPSIIGICADQEATSHRSKLPCSIQPRRFSDGLLYKNRHDFKNVRYFNLSPDDESSLVKQLGIKVTFIETDSAGDVDLLEKSFDCYRVLFPIKEERDKPDDILTWLDEARVAEITGSPWREIYGVIHTGDIVIGMAYLSIPWSAIGVLETTLGYWLAGGKRAGRNSFLSVSKRNWRRSITTSRESSLR